MGPVESYSAVLVSITPGAYPDGVNVRRVTSQIYRVELHICGQTVSLHLAPKMALELMQALDKQLLADDQEADGTAEKAEAEILDRLAAAGG